MTGNDRQLLENILDSLDRLFDDQVSAVDVWVICFATSEALRGTEHHAALAAVVPELLRVVRSEASADVQRERALEFTDRLRHYLADVLR